MKGPLVWLVLAGVGVALSAMVSAQSPCVTCVEAEWVNEGYDPDVPVSGRVIIGTMFLEAGHPNGNTLYVSVAPATAGSDVPSMQEGQLCINLMSRDGSYKGKWTAELADLEPPYLLEVQYITKEQAYYAEDRSDDLVALAAIKDYCGPGGTTQHILPVAWQRPTQTNLRVFINSSRMRTLLAIPIHEQVEGVEGGNVIKSVEVIECQQVEASQRIAFDRYCDIDEKTFKKEGEPQYELAELLRYRGPNHAPRVPFPLLR